MDHHPGLPTDAPPPPSVGVRGAWPCRGLGGCTQAVSGEARVPLPWHMSRQPSCERWRSELRRSEEAESWGKGSDGDGWALHWFY